MNILILCYLLLSKYLQIFIELYNNVTIKGAADMFYVKFK